MSSYSSTLAKRHAGVCQGSFIKVVESSAGGAKSSGSYLFSPSYSSTPTKVSEYCVLVGVRLTCYESWLNMDKGSAPTAIYSVVGASAVSNAKNASFRVVTNQGSHLWCCPPSTRCRDLWLSALHAGLERQYTASSAAPKTIQPVKPHYHATNMKNPPIYCNSCGKLERPEFPLVHHSSPLSQYGMESRMHLCPKCDVAQGVVEHVRWIQELYLAQYQEQEALRHARTTILKKVDPSLNVSDTEPTTQLELSPLSHLVVSGVLSSAACAAFRRVSPTLERLSIQFSQGLLGCMEFVELLEQAIGVKDPAMRKLKQQAFRMNGDMGTALRLLAEHALPNPLLAAGLDDDAFLAESSSIELLSCILEFFLDLLEEGELQSLAFFWPQLLNVHLRMLPPTDASSLQRIELMEDFLLTVATKHSIHLAIELIWSHTADLEDSKTLPYCAKRKSAILRFLCELESFLFDFEGGWGGGSVTVGRFLGPSSHQIAILRHGMQAVQKYRLSQPERLTRSQRHDKLVRERSEKHSGNKESSLSSMADEDMAMEALRIAKNADYLSTHLVFTKRLGDIAERLFYQPVEMRKGVLSTELAKLNSSGSMGGDPLNRVKVEDHQTRVVRIPMDEGHVFRSKERTPVLLLVEILDDAVEADEPRRAKALTPFPKAQQEQEEKNNPHEENDTKPIRNVKVAPPETASADENSNEGDAKSEQIQEDAEPAGATTEDKNDETEEGEASTRTGELQLKTDGLQSDESDKLAQEVSHTSSDDILEGDIPVTPPNELPEKTSSNDEAESEAPRKTEAEHSGLRTPRQEKHVETTGAFSESEDGVLEDSSPTRYALRRFHSPKGNPRLVTPLASKQSVEALVTNVVAKQLQLPSLMRPTKNSATEIAVEKSTECNVKGEQEAASDNGKATDQPVKASKMSALGSVGDVALSKTGDTRREVLNSLMMKAKSGNDSFAAGTATAMQRHLQDLERRRAVELLLTGDDKEVEKNDRQELLALGIRSASSVDLDIVSNGVGTSEDDEAMEAIRLLLIQYQVGQGSLSMNEAAKALAPHQHLRRMKKPSTEGTMMYFGKEFPDIDAGDVDSRLIGCGNLPPAVLQALTLRKANMISNGELLELVKKDLEFVKNADIQVEANKDKLKEDSAFWGRFAFGERWAEKRSRIAASSPDATKPGWDLYGVIVKANDDLRQEAFVMQLIELCQEAFDEVGLELWLLPYRILSTGRTTGIIEMVRNAMSFDALKKRPGYGTGGLREHLHRMTQFAADPSEAFKSAQRNFVRSLAAYSLLSYLFLFKDRHNGNILLDTAGHVIHIDFGFVFGVAPGGSFSLEISTPFKLTEEMIEVMDGLRSSLFSEFITLFCCGFLALQAHCDTFCTVVDITCKGSTFNCFEGRDSAEVVGKLRERFRPDLDKEKSIAFCLDIIKEATQSYGTAQYDYFQYLSQGIAA